MVRSYSPRTVEALQLLGTQIAAARRERRWTRDELIERVGISRQTLTAIEKGAPSVSIGTVFEVATLLRVPLFDTDPNRVSELRSQSELRLALLPERVRGATPDIDDDF